MSMSMYVWPAFDGLKPDRSRAASQCASQNPNARALHLHGHCLLCMYVYAAVSGPRPLSNTKVPNNNSCFLRSAGFRFKGPNCSSMNCILGSFSFFLSIYSHLGPSRIRFHCFSFETTRQRFRRQIGYRFKCPLSQYNKW